MILESLYGGEICPAEWLIPDTKEYQESRGRVADLMSVLEEKLSEEDFALVEEVYNALATSACEENKTFLSYGFSLGMQITIEVRELLEKMSKIS